MRLGVALLALMLVQTIDREERILHWLLTGARAAAPRRAIQVSLLSDSSTDASAPLSRRLRASSVPVVPLTARPRPDTLYLRVTRPVHDSVDRYRVGVDYFMCREGRMQGGRTIVTLRCSAVACNDYVETPRGDEGIDLGHCGPPP